MRSVRNHKLVPSACDRRRAVDGTNMISAAPSLTQAHPNSPSLSSLSVPTSSNPSDRYQATVVVTSGTPSIGVNFVMDALSAEILAEEDSVES